MSRGGLLLLVIPFLFSIAIAAPSDSKCIVNSVLTSGNVDCLGE
jgi:hypothetical protein